MSSKPTLLDWLVAVVVVAALFAVYHIVGDRDCPLPSEGMGRVVSSVADGKTVHECTPERRM